ncbi:hypothetical protein, partial [Staphylococcus aureus]|uniref:hypothetical protein n=1 Tax=Staphylococcus aureus TaxID=1280 RepID=UPI0019D62BBA
MALVQAGSESPSEQNLLPSALCLLPSSTDLTKSRCSPLEEVAPEKSNISAGSAENPASQQFSTQASDAAQQQQY